MASPFAKLPATPTVPPVSTPGAEIADQAKSSLQRLKGALGDESINPTAPCFAKPADKKDYAGPCPVCGKEHALANNDESKSEAVRLFDEVKANGVSPDLPYSKLNSKGNMFGALVCVDEEGKTVVLKAFSGHYNDTPEMDVPGFSPPVPYKNKLQNTVLGDQFDEAEKALKAMETGMREMNQAGAKVTKFQQELDKNTKQKKQALDQIGKDAANVKTWKEDLLKEGADERALNAKIKKSEERIQNLTESINAIDSALTSTQSQLTQAQEQFQAATKKLTDKYGIAASELNAKKDALKKARDEASAKLLNDEATNRFLENYNGEVRNFADACKPPEGVDPKSLSHHGQNGWCAAPKLLAEAKAKGLTPVSMTEFWMGKPAGNNTEGSIVPSCPHCKSFIGFALCGLDKAQKELAEELAK